MKSTTAFGSYNKTQLRKVLKRLQVVANALYEGRTPEYSGICRCLKMSAKHTDTEGRFLPPVNWQDMPGWSGSSVYPIPAVEWGDEANTTAIDMAVTAFEATMGKPEIRWDPRTPYGQARRAAVAWLLGQARKEHQQRLGKGQQ